MVTAVLGDDIPEVSCAFIVCIAVPTVVEHLPKGLLRVKETQWIQNPDWHEANQFIIATLYATNMQGVEPGIGWKKSRWCSEPDFN